MESMIDILFDQLVDSDAAWDTQHDKATQDALAELCEKLNLPTVHEAKLGELISTEAVPQSPRRIPRWLCGSDEALRGGQEQG